MSPRKPKSKTKKRPRKANKAVDVLPFDVNLIKSIPGMFVNGESMSEVLCDLGWHHNTVRAWRKKYKELDRAFELGEQYAEAWWSRLGRAGAVGKVKINPAVWIFNMKNRFAWTDRLEATGQIQTADLKLSRDQIQRMAKAVLRGQR